MSILGSKVNCMLQKMSAGALLLLSRKVMVKLNRGAAMASPSTTGSGAEMALLETTLREIGVLLGINRPVSWASRPATCFTRTTVSNGTPKKLSSSISGQGYAKHRMRLKSSRDQTISVLNF